MIVDRLSAEKRPTEGVRFGPKDIADGHAERAEANDIAMRSTIARAQQDADLAGHELSGPYRAAQFWLGHALVVSVLMAMLTMANRLIRRFWSPSEVRHGQNSRNGADEPPAGAHGNAA